MYTGLCIGERALTASEKDIKNKEEIKTLLDAAWEPERFQSYRTAEDIIRRMPPRLMDQTGR